MADDQYEFEWDTFRACMVAEGADGYATSDEDEWVEAYQFLIDTGIVWSLQGTFGRTAMQLIGEGRCHKRGSNEVLTA